MDGKHKTDEKLHLRPIRTKDGFYPDKRDSKLYFEQRGILSAAQNYLPLKGGEFTPKS